MEGPVTPSKLPIGNDRFFRMARRIRGTLEPKGGMDMMIGSVLGTVELSRVVPGAEGKRFVQVRWGSQLLTVLDPLNAKTGELVLLTAGEGAARLCPEVPVDAVILGIVGKNS